jgi:hypothetical protein
LVTTNATIDKTAEAREIHTAMICALSPNARMIRATRDAVAGVDFVVAGAAGAGLGEAGPASGGHAERWLDRLKPEATATSGPNVDRKRRWAQAWASGVAGSGSAAVAARARRLLIQLTVWLMIRIRMIAATTPSHGSGKIEPPRMPIAA